MIFFVGQNHEKYYCYSRELEIKIASVLVIYSSDNKEFWRHLKTSPFFKILTDFYENSEFFEKSKVHIFFYKQLDFHGQG